MGHAATRILRLFGKGLLSLVACGLALALGGCGGIDFQGKVFDYVGLSSLGKEQEDVRMTERAPLLVPPNTHKLPPPGSPDVTRADWPADTDKERKRLAAARQARSARRRPQASRTILMPASRICSTRCLAGTRRLRRTRSTFPSPIRRTRRPRTRPASAPRATPQKPVDQSLNAPATPAADDPFHPAAPDSYKGMSSPSGNNANY